MYCKGPVSFIAEAYYYFLIGCTSHTLGIIRSKNSRFCYLADVDKTMLKKAVFCFITCSFFQFYNRSSLKRKRKMKYPRLLVSSDLFDIISLTIRVEVHGVVVLNHTTPLMFAPTIGRQKFELTKGEVEVGCFLNTSQ
jgi:hypothetical protein